MKIQLQSLRVLNSGPLRDVCIQFNTNGDSPVTVLAGANGSGKTSIMELIVALFSTLKPGLAEGALSENWSEPPKSLVNTEFAQMDCLLDNEWFSLSYGKDDRVVVTPIGVNSTVTRLKYYNNRNRAFLSQVKPIEQRISPLIVQQEALALMFGNTTDRQTIQESYPLPSILYFPHVRFLPTVEGVQIQREEVNYHWVYRFENARSFGGSLDSYLIWLDYAEPEGYAQIIDFLNALDFDGKKFGVQRKELRAIVTTRDGQIHGVAELSSGEQNILIMLLELRRRLLPYSIVLIDEIENSLHAAFQHRLAQGLKTLQKEIPFQLIVTTHSSLFGRIFGPESVRILTEF